MGFLKKKSKKELLSEAILVLKKVEINIQDNTDCIWTSYENAKEIRDDISKYILQLESENIEYLDEIYSHFAPTSTFQEHSISNDWTDEYHKLAEKFDKIYEDLKNNS